MFKQNVGYADCIIRLALAAMIVVFSVITGHAVFAPLAIVPLLTSISGVCPLYSVLGLHT